MWHKSERAERKIKLSENCINAFKLDITQQLTMDGTRNLFGDSFLFETLKEHYFWFGLHCTAERDDANNKRPITLCLTIQSTNLTKPSNRIKTGR